MHDRARRTPPPSPVRALAAALVALVLAGPPGPVAHAETTAQTVAEAYPPPRGSTRVRGDAFGAWLGTLPLADPDTPVRTFDGREVPQDARVILLDLVPGDLQQCADTAIRLRAEWQRQVGADVVFHATSGDPLPWSRWQAGERPRVEGRRIQWSGGGTRGASETSWSRYLAAVFTWAGTASLATHDTLPVDDPRPGHVIVQGGFPGHAVVVLDVAHTPSGQVLLLVAEGFMPAQDAHVQHGPVEGWWPWDPQEGLALPYWPLPATALRRFRD
ncbi:DUF4846 domain-containing protein [Myxococcota bacterium]|nr:DUF4846 domain-containing protein [Myxococcota bacterium]